MLDLFLERSCIFSPCRLYRYELRIVWDRSLKPQMFIALNPSTADEENDDPTVRRCIDYAKRWGAGGLVMCNAMAFRATDPEVMLAYDGDQIGPENSIEFLERIALQCYNRPIAAWGKNADKVDCFMASIHPARQPSKTRGDFLKRFMGPLDCLRLNKDGSPCHPLYLPASLTPIPFNYGASK